MIGLLRPSRSNTVSSSSSYPYFNNSPTDNVPADFYCESAQARSSIDSGDSLIDETPPPSYDDVVGDEGYVPNQSSNVRHHECYRNKRSRKNRSSSASRFLDYGFQSSKIYVRD